MEVMKQYMQKNMPDIELPLIKKKTTGKGNRGYGSGLDNYIYINIAYLDQGENDTVFEEWSDSYIWKDHRWSVNPKLEPLYDFFGEELFEDFVKWYFTLDIRNKGSKDLNWVFE